MMAAIRLYLDSSDYSVLSDPNRRNQSAPGLLDDLRHWVAQGVIECYFSGILLSEMAPVESRYADASQRRADLLVELCGQHALVSQDILFAGELRYAIGLANSLPAVHSQKAEWYPDGVADISPVGEVDLVGSIDRTIKELGLNREARRAAQRKALKAGRPRAELKSAVVASARHGSLDEILAKYPMRPNDARVICRYAIGDATAAEASKAFLASLRDPRWMMRWFDQHHKELTPFIEWTRAPATKMLDSLSEMAEHAASVRATDLALGDNLADDLFSSAKWLKWQEDLLERIAGRMAKELLQQDDPHLSASIVDTRCPGLSVGIRSLHTAWRTVTQESPRKPKPSDVPDALHAVYAPYVDVFRADSFMAPHIKKVVESHSTIVVPKLSSLGTTLRSMLSERGDV